MENKFVAVLATIIILGFIAACTYTVNQPNNLVCEDFARSTENTYVMMQCFRPGSFFENRYDLVLTVESQTVSKENEQ